MRSLFTPSSNYESVSKESLIHNSSFVAIVFPMVNNKPKDIRERTKAFALKDYIRLYSYFAENNRISGTRQTKRSCSDAGLISLPAGHA